MSNWIKVFRTTPFKIEITRIAKQCGCSRGDAFLAWFQFYCWADDETETGHIPMMTAEDADTYAGLSGFGLALVSVGWLTIDETGGTITDFEKHNGSCSKKRSQTAQRVARFAHANAVSLVKTKKTNAAALVDEEKTNAESVSKLTQERYLDKIREEIDNNNTNTLGGVDERIQDSGNHQAAGKDRAPVAGQTEPEKTKSSVDAFELKADDEESKDCSNRNLKVIEEIYNAYPRKIAKGDAIKAIAKAIKKVPAKELLETVKAYAQSQVGNPEPQYIPYPASWFNSERWNDDRVSWVAWKSKTRDSGMDLGQKFVSTQPMGEWE